MPVGLFGEQRMSILVRRDGGFDALRMQTEIGVCVDGDADRAAKFWQMLVHDEIRIDEEDFIAGVEGRKHGEHDDAGGGAREDEQAGIGPAGVGDDFRGFCRRAMSSPMP